MDYITTDDIDRIQMHYNCNKHKFGASTAGNTWAKGHYTEAAELIDQVVDVITKETESRNLPQGFQNTHSLAGTGSGLDTLLPVKIKENDPDRIQITATLSIHQLLENIDETFVIFNGPLLYSMSHNILKEQPKYAELDWVISLVMNGITASLGFSGELNGDLRKMDVNLVPFPQIHFL